MRSYTVNRAEAVAAVTTTADRIQRERESISRHRWLRYALLSTASFFTLLDAIKQDAYNKALLNYMLPIPAERNSKQIASLLVLNDVGLTAVQMLVIGLLEQRVQPSVWCCLNLFSSIVGWLFFRSPILSLTGLVVVFAIRSFNVRYSMMVHWFGPLYYKYTMAVQFFISVLPYIVKLPLFHFYREVVFERQLEMAMAAGTLLFALVCVLLRWLESDDAPPPPTRSPCRMIVQQQNDDRKQPVITTSILAGQQQTWETVNLLTTRRLTECNSGGSLVISDSTAATPNLDLTEHHRQSLPPVLPSNGTTTLTVESIAAAAPRPNKTGSWLSNVSCTLFLAGVYYDFRVFDTYANQRLGYDFTYDMVYVHVGLFTTVFLTNLAYNAFKFFYRRWLRYQEYDHAKRVWLMNRARFAFVMTSFVGVLLSRCLFLALQLSSVNSYPLLVTCICLGGLGGNIQPLLAEFMFRQRTQSTVAVTAERLESGCCYGPIRSTWKLHSDQLFKWIYVDGRNLVNLPLLLLWLLVSPWVGSWWFSVNTIVLLLTSCALFLFYYFRHGRYVEL